LSSLSLVTNPLDTIASTKPCFPLPLPPLPRAALYLFAASLYDLTDLSCFTSPVSSST
jgi:hypothetical protein